MVTYATEILDYIYESVDKLKAINEFIVAFKKLSQLMKLKEDKETKLDIMLDEDLFEIYTVGAIRENWTPDLLITNQLLYQLSYNSMKIL